MRCQLGKINLELYFHPSATPVSFSSMMKMSIGKTTVEYPNEVEDLWGDEFWHVTVDLNDLEKGLYIQES